MFNICYRITGNFEEAEDVLQEAFVSAFKNIQAFEGRASFGAWLKRIVVNRAISHVKKRNDNLIELDQERMDVKDEGYDDNEIVLKINALKKAIEKLPEGFRIVFSLYLLEGYDHKEIADILEISESTSKTQYLRAKRKLKEILKAEVYYG